MIRAAFKGNSTRTYALILLVSLQGYLFTSCKKAPEPEPVLKITTLASGLVAPIGLEVDKKGWVWVSESGSAKNDGTVIAITPDGKKYPVVVGLPSIIIEGGELEGPAHILFADGILYILAVDKLYKADVAGFKAGDAPKQASTLAMEDIGAFVLKYPFQANTHMSHPYDLTTGPGGEIYITDAAANAILKRSKTGQYSVVAEVPKVAHQLPMGPNPAEPVPTGIYYDGQNFLITTLLGFPFPPGKAVIYKMTPTGAITVQQSGFTSLVDIAEGTSRGRLVLQHGVFALPAGFGVNTGKLTWADGVNQTVLTDGLNQPAGLKQADEHTWYVTSVADGTIIKVQY